MSVSAIRSALFTDLYQLTMCQAYLGEGMNEPAVFELFFRSLPDDRNFVMAAGLDDVLTWLENLCIDDDELEYLRSLEQFDEGFLERLRETRFTGDVYAVREGTLVFPNEPLVQVEAPMFEAQLIETLVLNQIHFQSVAAAKAARVVIAADGRAVVDFGSRRAHGTDAALKVARTSYLAGAAGTSNVLAGKLYGIPVFGTMAHSYIQAHDDEFAAFEAFTARYPGTTLLVDTYDTLRGVEKVIDLTRKMGDRLSVGSIRLDSGDIVALAKQSRKLLDDAGLHDVNIFASSGLQEYSIEAMLADGAPIDGFGVGTQLAVSTDAPDLDMAYKLVKYAGRPRMKLSVSKDFHPGRKQIFRRKEGETLAGDVIAGYDEALPGEPILETVMQGGKRTSTGRRTLADAREHAAAELNRLPAELRQLRSAENPYSVEISASLRQATAALEQSLESTQT